MEQNQEQAAIVVQSQARRFLAKRKLLSLQHEAYMIEMEKLDAQNAKFVEESLREMDEKHLLIEHEESTYLLQRDTQRKNLSAYKIQLWWKKLQEKLVDKREIRSFADVVEGLPKQNEEVEMETVEINHNKVIPPIPSNGNTLVVPALSEHSIKQTAETPNSLVTTSISSDIEDSDEEETMITIRLKDKGEENNEAPLPSLPKIPTQSEMELLVEEIDNENINEEENEKDETKEAIIEENIEDEESNDNANVDENENENEDNHSEEIIISKLEEDEGQLEDSNSTEAKKISNEETDGIYEQKVDEKSRSTNNTVIHEESVEIQTVIHEENLGGEANEIGEEEHKIGDLKVEEIIKSDEVVPINVEAEISGEGSMFTRANMLSEMKRLSLEMEELSSQLIQRFNRRTELEEEQVAVNNAIRDVALQLNAQLTKKKAIRRIKKKSPK
eukprot:TRINITY_DN505_c0_g1_i1.p1 TRINITY_DN505_c0_g1~~TRINITY_DN505_c0_g1_i1.p1  ORF type:complete len:445 (-),score=161.85 TRINITY_DN505_c0_g1_i1:142-1476(-)